MNIITKTYLTHDEKQLRIIFTVLDENYNMTRYLIHATHSWIGSVSSENIYKCANPEQNKPFFSDYKGSETDFCKILYGF